MNFQRVSEDLHLKLGFCPEYISADTCLSSPILHLCPNSFLKTFLKYTFCNYRHTRKVCSEMLTGYKGPIVWSRHRSPGASLSPLASAQLAHLVGCEGQRLHCLLGEEEIAFGLVTWCGFLRSNGQDSMSPSYPWEAFGNGLSLTRKRKV